jgi:hypothetical protein
MPVKLLQLMCSLDAALLYRVLVPADCLIFVWRHLKRSHYQDAREGQCVYRVGSEFDRAEMMLKTTARFFIVWQIAQPRIVRPRQLEVRLDILRIHTGLDIGKRLIDLRS